MIVWLKAIGVTAAFMLALAVATIGIALAATHSPYLVGAIVAALLVAAIRYTLLGGE